MSNSSLRSRTKKTADELAATLIKALHAHPECHGVQVSKLMPLPNAQVGFANWDAEFAAKPGTTMSPDCKRVALSAKHGVQKHFDLAVA
jgi:hypothetical protein